jgi:hypothetical protein
MTKAQAIELAQVEATTHGINIVVTYNPYAEEFRDEDKYSYHPENAHHIFKYETSISLITPQEK